VEAKKSIVNVRVEYSHTDKMEYVHHSQYLVYYEYARWEHLRNYGLCYKDIETKGIMMPVISAKIDYLKPAFYDDILEICTELKVEGARFIFFHKIYNNKNELINTAEITVACIDCCSKKPIKPINTLINCLN